METAGNPRVYPIKPVPLGFPNNACFISGMMSLNPSISSSLVSSAGCSFALDPVPLESSSTSLPV